MRLVGRENISTREKFSHIKKLLLTKIKTLTDDRTHLRKQTRRNMSGDELSNVKEQIATITTKLWTLRKEVNLCDEIAERSRSLKPISKLKEQTEKKQKERRRTAMTNGGDAAEQVVRLSLEGFEVAAKLSGAAAKNIAVLLISVLKQEQKTKGKARLTNMIKSGKELKVFSIPNKDFKKFTEQAKRYGVLYCVLRDKNTKGE